MATGYLEILRARHAVRLLVGTLVGRLPNATAAIAIVLFIRAEGGSYSLAGALAAVYGVANAVGQPLLGRLVDLYGQPRVQLPAALVSALAMAVFAFTGTGSLPLAYAARGRRRTLHAAPGGRSAGAVALRPPQGGPGAHGVRDGRGGAGSHVHRRAVAGDAVRVPVVRAGRAARPQRRRGAGRALRGRLAALARVAFGAARGALARRAALARAPRPARRVPFRRNGARLHHGRGRVVRGRPRRRRDVRLADGRHRARRAGRRHGLRGAAVGRRAGAATAGAGGPSGGVLPAADAHAGCRSP